MPSWRKRENIQVKSNFHGIKQCLSSNLPYAFSVFVWCSVRCHKCCRCTVWCCGYPRGSSFSPDFWISYHCWRREHFAIMKKKPTREQTKSRSLTKIGTDRAPRSSEWSDAPWVHPSLWSLCHNHCIEKVSAADVRIEYELAHWQIWWIFYHNRDKSTRICSHEVDAHARALSAFSCYRNISGIVNRWSLLSDGIFSRDLTASVGVHKFSCRICSWNWVLWELSWVESFSTLIKLESFACELAVEQTNNFHPKKLTFIPSHRRFFIFHQWTSHRESGFISSSSVVVELIAVECKMCT